jgi:type IV secretion system protein VirB10
MSPVSPSPPDDESTPEREGTPAEETPPEAPARHVAGDRGIPSINRARSIQSRVSTALAIGLMAVLGAGFLAWYYTKALTRPLRAQQAAQQASKSRAQGEMPLPSLGVHWPFTRSDAASSATSASNTAATPSEAPPQGQAPGGVDQFLGPQPPPPGTATTGATVPPGMTPQGLPGTPRPKTPGQLAFARRLAGPAFARASRDSSTVPEAPLASPVAAAPALAAAPAPNAPAEHGGSSAAALSGLLRPTVTPAVSASVLPTQRFLLAKGTFIDCTLETAIDSTLPGMTTCITATDTFSADGAVVLLERGTKLVGETRGEVQQGSSRIFVLWTEARTPTGVVVPLSSPGTDELGRSGLPGEVNRHFWDRFGAAILLTVINGAVQGAVNSQNSTGSVVISPSNSTDVMTEILRGTVNIPPTVTKREGDRIQVFVARDVDFRSVYTLRTAAGTTEKAP